MVAACHCRRERRLGGSGVLAQRWQPLGGGDPGAGRDPDRRAVHLQERLDRAQEPQPEHERPHVDRSHWGDGDRPLAGSGDGDGPLRLGGGHRSPFAGPRPRCDPGADGSRPGDSHGTAQRRQLVRRRCQDRGRWQPCAGQAGRAHRARWHDSAGAVIRQSGADHGREPAGREGSGRLRVRRHHQRIRVVRISRHRSGKRLHTGTDHSRRRGRARQSSAHAALR